MLDIEKIKQLIDMMVSNDLVEISLRDGDLEVNLRRPTVGAGDGVPMIVGQPAPAAPQVAAQPHAAPPAGAGGGDAGADDDLIEITSPMVGTFYASADPDSPPFVKAGAHISADSVVCIIEAMKVFNEIKAEVTGTIERVLVKNQQPVEFGQPLFLVRS